MPATERIRSDTHARGVTLAAALAENIASLVRDGTVPPAAAAAALRGMVAALDAAGGVPGAGWWLDLAADLWAEVAEHIDVPKQ